MQSARTEESRLHQDELQRYNAVLLEERNRADTLSRALALEAVRGRNGKRSSTANGVAEGDLKRELDQMRARAEAAEAEAKRAQRDVAGHATEVAVRSVKHKLERHLLQTRELEERLARAQAENAVLRSDLQRTAGTWSPDVAPLYARLSEANAEVERARQGAAAAQQEALAARQRAEQAERDTVFAREQQAQAATGDGLRADTEAQRAAIETARIADAARDEAERARAALARELQESERTVAAMRAALENASGEALQARANATHLEANLAQEAEAAVMARAQAAARDTEAEELARKFVALEQDLADLTSALAAARDDTRAERAGRVAEAEMLRREVAQRETLTRELETTRSVAAEAGSTVRRAERTADAATAEAEKLRQALRASEGAVAELTSRAALDAAQRNEAALALRAREEENATLRAQLEKGQAALNEAASALSMERAAAKESRDKTAALSRRVDSLQKELAKACAERDALEVRVQQAELTARSATTDRTVDSASADSELTVLRGRLAHLEMVNSRSVRAARELNDALTEAQAQKAAADLERQAACEESRGVREELRAARAAAMSPHGLRVRTPEDASTPSSARSPRPRAPAVDDRAHEAARGAGGLSLPELVSPRARDVRVEREPVGAGIALPDLSSPLLGGDHRRGDADPRSPVLHDTSPRRRDRPRLDEDARTDRRTPRTEHETTALGQRVHDATSEGDRARARATEAETRVKELERSHVTAAGLATGLQAQLEAVQRERTQLVASVAELQGRLDTLRAGRSGADDDAKDAQRLLATLRAELATLDRERHTALATARAAEGQVAVLRTELAVALRERGALRAEVSAGREANAARDTAECEDMARERNAARGDLERAELRVVDLLEELSTSERSRHQAEERLQAERSSLSARDDTAHMELSSLRARVVALEKQVAALKEERATLIAERDRERASTPTGDGDQSRRSPQRSGAAAALDEAQKRASQESHRAREFEADCARLRAERNTAAERLETTEDLLAVARKEQGVLRARVAQLEGELAGVRDLARAVEVRARADADSRDESEKALSRAQNLLVAEQQQRLALAAALAEEKKAREHGEEKKAREHRANSAPSPSGSPSKDGSSRRRGSRVGFTDEDINDKSARLEEQLNGALSDLRTERNRVADLERVERDLRDSLFAAESDVLRVQQSSEEAAEAHAALVADLQKQLAAKDISSPRRGSPPRGERLEPEWHVRVTEGLRARPLPPVSSPKSRSSLDSSGRLDKQNSIVTEESDSTLVSFDAASAAHLREQLRMALQDKDTAVADLEDVLREKARMEQALAFASSRLSEDSLRRVRSNSDTSEQHETSNVSINARAILGAETDGSSEVEDEEDRSQVVSASVDLQRKLIAALKERDAAMSTSLRYEKELNDLREHIDAARTQTSDRDKSVEERDARTSSGTSLKGGLLVRLATNPDITLHSSLPASASSPVAVPPRPRASSNSPVMRAAATDFRATVPGSPTSRDSGDLRAMLSALQREKEVLMRNLAEVSEQLHSEQTRNSVLEDKTRRAKRYLDGSVAAISGRLELALRDKEHLRKELSETRLNVPKAEDLDATSGALVLARQACAAAETKAMLLTERLTATSEERDRYKHRFQTAKKRLERLDQPEVQVTRESVSDGASSGGDAPTRSGSGDGQPSGLALAPGSPGGSQRELRRLEAELVAARKEIKELELQHSRDLHEQMEQHEQRHHDELDQLRQQLEAATEKLGRQRLLHRTRSEVFPQEDLRSVVAGRDSIKQMLRSPVAPSPLVRTMSLSSTGRSGSNDGSSNGSPSPTPTRENTRRALVSPEASQTLARPNSLSATDGSTLATVPLAETVSQALERVTMERDELRDRLRASEAARALAESDVEQARATIEMLRARVAKLEMELSNTTSRDSAVLNLTNQTLEDPTSPTLSPRVVLRPQQSGLTPPRSRFSAPARVGSSPALLLRGVHERNPRKMKTSHSVAEPLGADLARVVSQDPLSMSEGCVLSGAASDDSDKSGTLADGPVVEPERRVIWQDQRGPGQSVSPSLSASPTAAGGLLGLPRKAGDRTRRRYVQESGRVFASADDIYHEATAGVADMPEGEMSAGSGGSGGSGSVAGSDRGVLRKETDSELETRTRRRPRTDTFDRSAVRFTLPTADDGRSVSPSPESSQSPRDGASPDSGDADRPPGVA